MSAKPKTTPPRKKYVRRKAGPNAPGAGRPPLAIPSVRLNTNLSGPAGKALTRLRGIMHPGAFLSGLILREAKRKGLE